MDPRMTTAEKREERRQRFAEIALKHYLETADINTTQEDVAQRSFRMAELMLREEPRL